jgi:hypothetical protein
MTALKTRNNVFLKAALLATLTLASTLAQAQHTGDWQTTPGPSGSDGLQDGGGGDWDNENNNSNGDANTWQMYNGTSWVQENGNVAGTGYPSNNTGLITILTGTTITNASSSTITNNADGIVVQSGASFIFGDGSFTLLHPSPANSEFTNDLDVFGNFGLENNHSFMFFLDTNATIVMESGSTMTNYCLTSGDLFTGPGYTNASGTPPYVANAITFKSNSTCVMYFNPADPKGWVPYATWQPGSTCLITGPASTPTAFVPKGLPGQTFYDFNWYWTNETSTEQGSSTEGGSFTVAHNFSMTASGTGCENKDIPYSGYTLTVGNNFSVTNVTFAPTASAGIVTLNVGGNFSVDDTAILKIGNDSGWGNVTFNGTNGTQTLYIGADNGGNPGSSDGSPAAWNWTVASGSSLSVNSAWVVNGGPGGAPGTAGFITNYGTITLTTNGSLTGGSNTIILGPGSTFNVTAGTFAFGDNDTLEGSGTVAGSVTASNTTVIWPNSGTSLTFNGSLTYGGATSTNIFTLTSSTSGANDRIVLGGAGGVLTPNGAQVVINSAGTLATANYVLFNVIGGGGSISTAFNSTPAWIGTAPANSNDYTVVTSGTQVLLQYTSPSVPQPGITGISLSGTTNLVLKGTNGVAGTYTVLMATNLPKVLSSWTSVGSFTLGSSGSFTEIVTNAVTPGDKAQFFVLKAP